MRIRERKLFTSHLYALHAEQLLRRKKAKMMKKVFNEYDLDKSGRLTKEEFINAWIQHSTRRKRSSHMLRKIAGHGVDSQSKKRTQAEQIFAALDLDGNGWVDFEEFTSAWEKFGLEEIDMKTQSQVDLVDDMVVSPPNSDTPILLEQGGADIQHTVALDDDFEEEIMVERSVSLNDAHTFNIESTASTSKRQQGGASAGEETTHTLPIPAKKSEKLELVQDQQYGYHHYLCSLAFYMDNDSQFDPSLPSEVTTASTCLE